MLHAHGPSACLYCKLEFTFKSSRLIDIRKFCSLKCFGKYESERKQGVFLRTEEYPCQHCGKSFRPKSKHLTTYCSRECYFVVQAARPSCAVYFPNCKQCNQAFTARHKSRQYCSKECVYLKFKNDGRYEISKQRAHEGYVSKPARKAACLICSRTFETTHQGAAKYCSVACVKESERDVKREQKRLRKALTKEAFVKRVIRRHIYERDNWRCGICHRKVNRNLKSPHPSSKSIDHIVPLANGGTHEPRNVQLAHYGCNSRRSNKGAAQLRLLE